MISKKKGAEDKCPSCQTMLVCREKDYKGEITLQWQYKDKEVAHFNYDFKTKKTSCKEISETTVRPTSARIIDLDSLSIPKDQQEHIIESSEEMAERMFCILKGVQNAAAKVGETNPAGIGMVYNQVCANRRAE
jgi:hypothetical protein